VFIFNELLFSALVGKINKLDTVCGQPPTINTISYLSDRGTENEKQLEQIHPASGTKFTLSQQKI